MVSRSNAITDLIVTRAVLAIAELTIVILTDYYPRRARRYAGVEVGGLSPTMVRFLVKTEIVNKYYYNDTLDSFDSLITLWTFKGQKSRLHSVAP